MHAQRTRTRQLCAQFTSTLKLILSRQYTFNSCSFNKSDDSYITWISQACKCRDFWELQQTCLASIWSYKHYGILTFKIEHSTYSNWSYKFTHTFWLHRFVNVFESTFEGYMVTMNLQIQRNTFCWQPAFSRVLNFAIPKYLPI